MSVGVITHLPDVDFDQVRRLAIAAEEAGADWLGVPDAFWWRDSWVLLAEVAEVTSNLRIGPVVTNPYLRHPFHTVAAVATLQDLAGDRVLLGLGAGGSELTGAAGVDRSDAGERIVDLARLFERVARTGELHDSGRTLEVPLDPPRILVAGRGRGVLRAAGAVADDALLWAVPHSELDRTIATIRAAAADAVAAGTRSDDGPSLVWAPLVELDERSTARLRDIAAYSVLNSRAELQRSWGLGAPEIEEIRRLLVANGPAAAADEIPDVALADLVLGDPDPVAAGRVAAARGITSFAVPAFDLAEVGDQVQWARAAVDAARAAAAPPAPVPT